MNALIILNDPAYGTERTYNGLRLAMSLSRQEGVTVRVFLMGDAVTAARAGQTTAAGYYNLERMIGSVAKHGGRIGACGTCIDARGIRETELIPGTHRSSMDELTAWTLQADKVVTI